MCIDQILCQKILVAVESDPIAGTGQRVNIDVDDYESNVIGQHIHYLVETKMLKGIDVTNMGSPHREYIITEITPEGRAHLDTLETQGPATPKRYGF